MFEHLRRRSVFSIIKIDKSIVITMLMSNAISMSTAWPNGVAVRASSGLDFFALQFMYEILNKE